MCYSHEHVTATALKHWQKWTSCQRKTSRKTYKHCERWRTKWQPQEKKSDMFVWKPIFHLCCHQILKDDCLWKNSGYAAGLQEEKDKKKEKTRKRKVLSDKKKSAPLRASSFWRLNSYHIFILFNSIDFGLVIGKSNKSCTVMQSIDIILSLQPIAK